MPRRRWNQRLRRRRKRDGEDHKPECEKAVASVKKRCGILQQKQQGNVGRSSSSSALWLSEDKGRNEDVPSVVEKRRKTGKLGSTNHARQCYQPPARNYRGERQNEVEMGDNDTKPDKRRTVLNLRPDISSRLARKEIISMPRSECIKRIAKFRNEGPKN